MEVSVSRRLSARVRVGIVILTSLVIFSLAGCSALFDLFLPKGTVSGTVWDATTGVGISSVRVTVDGRSSYSATTDSYGDFEFDVPAGSVTLHFVLAGYEFSDVTVTVTSGETTVIYGGQIVGSPPLQTGAFRFVLTWGEEPNDLDSHLLTPGGQHVSFEDDAPTGAGATLDRDDTSSYGPETITITVPQVGTYRYFVHNYSGTPDITSSGGQVRVYDETGLITTVSVPTTGTGRYWNVFTLSGGTLTSVNQIVADEPAAALFGIATPGTK